MTGSAAGPLAGLRVLELATGVAGPYAGRLLVMLGATVVKVEPPGGDPARRMPIDDRPVTGTSPLFVHLNAGKANVGASPTEAMLEWADVVIDDRVRGHQTDLGASRDRGPKVLVSITAWGFDADDAGEPADELLVQAASAALGLNSEPGRESVRYPGWQSQYLAGGYAAASALACLGEDGFRHVDVSWVGAMMSGVESGLAAELHRPRRDSDSAAVARDIGAGVFPAGAFPCADGHFVPGTVRPIDWELQCRVYGREDLIEDERFSAALRMRNREELRAEIQPWYDAHAKRDIFGAALETGWAGAMVMTAEDLLGDPHIAERKFLSAVDGSTAMLAGRPWRSASIPEQLPVRLAAQGADTMPGTAAKDTASRPVVPSVGELKIVELTWAWAGPFIGRFLGALGADVIRIETGKHPDGWRSRVRWRDVGVPLADGTDPDDITWDAAHLHNTINRNKRSLSLDLSTDDGRAVLARLLENADAMVVNMGYSVLTDRSIDGIVRAAIADGLVMLQMPALGATGPYRSMPGYGTLIEGMGGLAARMGYLDRGAWVTNTYYPDAVAGLHGTIAVLAGLIERRTTGRGAFIDLSQQETMWMQLGEGIVLRSVAGREPDRLGNAEPGVAPSGIYSCADGEVALIAKSDDEFAALVKLLNPALDAFAGLNAGERIARRREVDAALASALATRGVADLREAGLHVERVLKYTDGRSALGARELTEEVDHPVTGTRSYVRIPIRIEGNAVPSVRHAPVFAQHTDEVLVDWLAMEEEERTRLRAAEVIGTRPVRISRRS